jgi:hypothetical protein
VITSFDQDQLRIGLHGNTVQVEFPICCTPDGMLRQLARNPASVQESCVEYVSAVSGLRRASTSAMPFSDTAPTSIHVENRPLCKELPSLFPKHESVRIWVVPADEEDIR